MVRAVADQRWRHHEVSILIAAAARVGQCFGSHPRAKVSMMNMRPPQQGHGRGSMRGSSAAGASGVSGRSERAGTASNSRAWAMLAARLPLASARSGGCDPEFNLCCNRPPPLRTRNCEYRLLDLCLGEIFDFFQLHMGSVGQFVRWNHAVDNRRAFRLECLVDGVAQLAGLFGPEAHAAAGARQPNIIRICKVEQ
jgi:hypothetical protein